jgi:hypothetical protein
MFSDQLIEHLHPQDTAEHFCFVRRLLKRGGNYLFRTPHALSGPHDVSAYFSDVPLGFHLKEWTYTELEPLLAETGFKLRHEYWALRGHRAALPKMYFRLLERAIARVGGRSKRLLARMLVPTIEVVAEAR